jgi:hypothetical protein
MGFMIFRTNPCESRFGRWLSNAAVNYVCRTAAKKIEEYWVKVEELWRICGEDAFRLFVISS